MKQCTECGAKNTNSAKICNDCGSEIKKNSEKIKIPLTKEKEESIITKEKEESIITKEKEESLITNELRNTNKILNIIEGHLFWLATAAMLGIAMMIITIITLIAG